MEIEIFQEERSSREAQEGDSNVSDINTLQATDLRARQGHHSAHRIGHILCIQVLQVSQSPTGQTTSDITHLARNIRFLKGGEIIPHTHPNIEFADNVSITFECQKREQKHDTITHEASSDLVICPVWFAAGLVQWIWSYSDTDMNSHVSTYMTNMTIEHITSAQVVNALRHVVGAIGETGLRIAKHEVGTHSLRSRVAMAMYLGECRVYTIMLIGRCSNDAFFWYIKKACHGIQPQYDKENAEVQTLLTCARK
jgi:hypothetical protein